MITTINEFRKSSLYKKINENEVQTLEPPTLSKRDQSLINQGKLIVTKAQLAVCYLVALEAVNGQIPKFSRKMTYDYNIECGMNPETFRRTIKKFDLLITGKSEDTEETDKEHLYPKIITAYEEFVNMNKNDIYALAETAFTEENLAIGIAVAADKDAASDLYKSNIAAKEKTVINKLESAFEFCKQIYKNKHFTNKQLKELTINQAIKDLLKLDEFKNAYISEDPSKKIEGLQKLNTLCINMWAKSGKLSIIK